MKSNHSQRSQASKNAIGFSFHSKYLLSTCVFAVNTSVSENVDSDRVKL